MSRLHGYVEKGWGSEFIFASNDKYCGKILNFKEGAEFSMHFHAEKDETWLIVDGEFEVTWINTENSRKKTATLLKDSIWHNEPLSPHKLRCIKAGTIIEVSTPDSVEDNYRIEPGDSQSIKDHDDQFLYHS